MPQGYYTNAKKIAFKRNYADADLLFSQLNERTTLIITINLKSSEWGAQR